MSMNKVLRALFVTAPLAMIIASSASADTAAAACLNCGRGFSSWECLNKIGSGGTSCTVNTLQDTCTVSGNCDSPGFSLDVRPGASLVLQIAASHPRVAATVFMLTSGRLAPSEGKVFWGNSPMTAADVQKLVQEQPMGLQPTPGEAVIHAATLQPLPPVNGKARALLRIVPLLPSPLDPSFSEFRLIVGQGYDPANPAAYTPVSWTLQ
jgi:hypothetical protein